MEYVGMSLGKDEKIIASIKHSWAGLVSSFICFAVFIAIGVVLCFPNQIFKPIFGAGEEDIPQNILILFYGIAAFCIFWGSFIFVSQFVEIKCARLVVTNKRLLGRRGFIRKNMTDILLSKVDTLNVTYGLFGTIFHYGAIEVVSAASATTSAAKRGMLRYSFISNTTEFRKAVLDAIDKVKEEERAAQTKSFSQALKGN